jgi:DNA-binding CsgD family transcriptional regulator
MDAPTRPGISLTAREREAAALVAEGLTDRQIAARLCISERTVHAHLRAAFAKTGSRSRVMLALWVSHQD